VDHERVIALALVNGPLPKTGVIVAASLVGVAVLARPPRVRALAMLALLVLTPALLLANIWNSKHLDFVHHHPLEAAVGALVALAVIVLVAAMIARRPWVVAPLVVLTLPFRIPITTDGTTSNLLLPLYVVLAAAALAYIGSVFGVWGRASELEAPPGDAASTPGASAAVWMERLLVAYVILYAIQATYSLDFQLALQQVVFFYVPFALAYCLLRQLRWDSRLLRICLLLTVALALVFSGVAFIEYATRSIFLNHKLMATNADHPYFAVNSVFYDSNILGRFLALAMVLLSVTLIYPWPRREQLGAVAALAIIWVALVLSLSRTSLAALLAGLIVLAAIRWRVSRAVVAVVAVVAVGAAVVAITPHTFGLEQGANGVFAGRGSLVTGGLHMFGQRPVWGYGSGSFQTEYLSQNRNSPGGVGDSHTVPVTIAAEQGLIGELVYLAFMAAAAVMLLRGVRGDPVRAVVAAAFAGLVVHTMLYADFLSDPITWTLLGIGAALAREPRVEVVPEAVPSGATPQPVPAGT
jgi:putative inorganic carbon (HCO3(-)) transporter